MTTGIVTATGPAIVHRGVTVQLPAERTSLGEWVAEMVAAIDAGELLPCRHCGVYGECDCEEWIKTMAGAGNADPHADLTVWLEGEIPF